MIATGISLSVSALPLGFLLSLMAEARRRVERALLSIEPGSGRDARCEMQLLAALGPSQTPVKSHVLEAGAVWVKAGIVTSPLGLPSLAALTIDRRYHLGQIARTVSLVTIGEQGGTSDGPVVKLLPEQP